MVDRPPTIVVCSCEDTIKLDAGALRRGCRGARVETAKQLCRAELDRFQVAAAAGAPLIVGCTQEAPRFAEAAQSSTERANLTFVNVRETAGWSRQAADAGAKMAALLAAAAGANVGIDGDLISGGLDRPGRAEIEAAATAHNT